ncbi:MAG: DUF2975 domain-containing protein [Hyphomonadaceae bacterium JAD_PAG50586_4]|nr:MAG: DUF2975 domain-containing protein [Hyphomonadaceae bacterium JAD_PAG50586_4]
MTQAAAVPLERAQQLAGGASTVAVVGAVLIVLAAVAGEVDPVIMAARNREVTPDLLGAAALISAVGVFWLMALPSFLLAGAMLDLSKVLDEYGKGRFFTLRASAHVRKAGEGAIWALVFKILASPTILSWITHEGRGFIWHIEPFDLGLFAFAAAVMVLGRVLEAAAKIKAENDEIV